MNFRSEKDSFGNIDVPADAYYGAQTARSLRYFNISEEKFHQSFIQSYAILKLACAKVNERQNKLDKKLASAIKQAAQEIIDGKMLQEFQLSVWQTGSGTQTNMNLNEVIANRANEILGHKLGEKGPVHQNDHVNMSQSTNDTFPTVMHIATARCVNSYLLPALLQLKKTFEQKSQDFKSIVKMGRTHLQDATPITLGQEISGWVYQLQICDYAIKQNIVKIYELAVGGTAVGTGINAPVNFSEQVCVEVANIANLPFIPSPNKFAALAGHEPIVILSGCFNALACALLKIANDIRWMASGPRGGLGEITIAENEPGSSIMPGKVNPTQCEALSMVCCQVMGNNSTISLASSQGNFELNVYKPVIIYNLLQSIEILSDCLNSFNDYCAVSIKPNLSRLDELKTRSLMLVTALAPFIGYDKSAMIAKKAHAENKTLKEVVLELKLMSETEFDDRVQPEKMC